jgi:hypothetical protein
MRNQQKARREAELASLEREFREKLIVSLRGCAAGHWGLLGQNAHIAPEYARSDAADELLALGEAIEALRREAGIAEPYELYKAFKSKRGRQDSNQLGEPRLAQKWLAELGE